MSRWRRFLHQSSRSRGFLWRFAFGMLALGTIAGYALHRWHPMQSDSLETHIVLAIADDVTLRDQMGDTVDISAIVLQTLHAELEARPRDFEQVLDFMPSLAHWAPTATKEQVLGILQPRFAPESSSIAVDLMSVCRTSDASARERLQAAASAQAPVRHAAHALGLAALAREEYHAASTFFRQEGRFPDATRSRRMAIDCLVTAEDFATLAALKSEPEYAGLFTARIELEIATRHRDWPAILRTVPASQFSGLDPAITALTLVSGFAWAFVLGHLGQIPRLRSGLTLLCLLGLAAGIVSTTPTIYAVIWQDEILGFTPEGDFLRSVIYFIGAVGVREEVCKLALFVPFLPILLRRDSELDALIVASFVGLGFAVEENGNYFLSSGGTAAAARLLTANFFHVALTGLNGLALYRAFTRGAAGINELLTVLGVTIIAHGLYDALLSLPDAGLGSYLSLAVYVLTCQYYFTRAHELRDDTRMTISLSGAFVAGISALACAMITYQMVRLGPAAGLSVALPEFIGTIVLLVMFFREFNETLTE